VDGGPAQGAGPDALDELKHLAKVMAGRPPLPGTDSAQVVASNVQRINQIDNRSVIFRSERLVLGVTDEDQRQVVGIPSKEEFRCAVGYLPTRRKEVTASQYGLDPIQLANRTDVEGNRPETQRLLAMASLMKTPRFTKDQDDGCGRHTTQHHDCLLASDLIEGTDVPVEGNGSIEVANGDQCGTNGPRLCDVVSGHGVPP
jgi:hypothetical protein